VTIKGSLFVPIEILLFAVSQDFEFEKKKKNSKKMRILQMEEAPRQHWSKRQLHRLLMLLVQIYRLLLRRYRLVAKAQSWRPR
jgi:hypothetical protein